MATYRWTTDSAVELHATSSVHRIHGEIHDIRGEATVTVIDGVIQLDPSPTGYIEADSEALKSGNKLEDFEMKRRLEVKKDPTIRYEVRQVTGGPERFTVQGALTFHGVTQEFSEECTARIDNGSLKLEAEHTFDIRQFDVQPPRILNLQVHPEVKIVLHLVGKEI